MKIQLFVFIPGKQWKNVWNPYLLSRVLIRRIQYLVELCDLIQDLSVLLPIESLITNLNNYLLSSGLT